jgi:hypothetical protein
MPDPLEEILVQVASGQLSPDDAEPIIAALAGSPSVVARDEERPASTSRLADTPGTRRAVRVLVREGGRTVVNLQIPMSWAGLTSLVPGLSSAQVQLVSDALRNGERGPIVDIQDADGDGVVISTE